MKCWKYIVVEIGWYWRTDMRMDIIANCAKREDANLKNSQFETLNSANASINKIYDFEFVQAKEFKVEMLEVLWVLI